MLDLGISKIALIGAVALFELPVAQYPDIAPPTINVTGQYPGASAEVVASTVVSPIEDTPAFRAGLKSGDLIIKIDKDGNITLIPHAGAKVRLGSGTPAQLDQVALYTQLKSDFDAFVATYNGHVHPGVTVGLGSTGTTPAAATSMSPSVGSANVVAKKP